MSNERGAERLKSKISNGKIIYGLHPLMRGQAESKYVTLITHAKLVPRKLASALIISNDEENI